MLQSGAGDLLRGTLGAEWPWALMQIPRWLTWVPFTPIIFSAAERFPFRRERLARSIWMHLGISLAIAVVIEVLWLQISFVLQRYIEPEVLARMQQNRAEVYSDRRAQPAPWRCLHLRRRARGGDVARLPSTVPRARGSRGAARGTAGAGAGAGAQDAGAPALPVQHAARRHRAHSRRSRPPPRASSHASATCFG